MDKPEDIPQDVWDEALRQWRIGRGFVTIDIIARAILKVKEDEREECAKILDHMADQQRGCLVLEHVSPQGKSACATNKHNANR